MIHHRIDRVFQFENLAFNIDRDLLCEIACGNGSGHGGDVAHLCREVGGHEIDIVSKILPYACQTAHIGLSAQLAFRTDFACHTGDFGSERTELVHHSVDRVLQFKNLTLDIDSDFFGQVAHGHRSSHRRDIADLCRKIGRH